VRRSPPREFCVHAPGARGSDAVERVTGFIEGLEPEQHWRLMVGVLAVLFLVGVLMGAVEARAAAPDAASVPLTPASSRAAP
jgi:hypothetical protein